ncbi:MAG: adenosylcobinamide-GDP ribazoletransferase, partial [Planctomycetota bacterium]|nr:adenosylcobinamide-GDP ribazoletransferase [Planctomycetota bacterium]
LSRWSMVIAGAFLGPARKEGLARMFLSGLRTRHWLFATLLTALLVSGLAGPDGVALCLVGLVVTLACLIRFKTTIGGLTGDTLGAINEMTEVSGLLACYLLFAH